MRGSKATQFPATEMHIGDPMKSTFVACTFIRQPNEHCTRTSKATPFPATDVHIMDIYTDSIYMYGHPGVSIHMRGSKAT